MYRNKILGLIALWIFLFNSTFANNIQISNVRLTGQNTNEHSTMVEFDISWENSWRVVGGPGNWDAAWIFIKYRIGAGPWNHAWLNNTGHTICSDNTISMGLLSPSAPFDPSTNPVIGVFLYRAEAGSGTFSCNDVQLKWNYGANGLSDNEQVDIRVFAIEQVYVPGGSFKVGSGGSELGAFFTYPTTTQPYAVTSEGAINVGTNNGDLYYNNSGSCGDRLGPIPNEYPKGYNAFYVMKYEVSQKGYTDFLNSLTRAQQITRVRSNITGTSVPNNYVMINSPSISNRSSIWTFTTIPQTPAPVKFYCNYNQNTTGDEMGDGQNIACNALTMQDVLAYLDWSGLRPITEFEFEKACRGPIDPVPNEFAWGNNYAFQSSTINNPGLPNEQTNPLANIVYNTGGPLRCGAIALANNDREKSGATYYGVMDMSGNLWERGVTVGLPEGRIFKGHHGNGMLTTDGNANVNYWPDIVTSKGMYTRAGSFIDSPYGGASYLSSRPFAAYIGELSTVGQSARGGRLAP